MKKLRFATCALLIASMIQVTPKTHASNWYGNLSRLAYDYAPTATLVGMPSLYAYNWYQENKRYQEAQKEVTKALDEFKDAPIRTEPLAPPEQWKTMFSPDDTPELSKTEYLMSKIHDIKRKYRVPNKLAINWIRQLEAVAKNKYNSLAYKDLIMEKILDEKMHHLSMSYLLALGLYYKFVGGIPNRERH